VCLKIDYDISNTQAGSLKIHIILKFIFSLLLKLPIKTGNEKHYHLFLTYSLQENIFANIGVHLKTVNILLSNFFNCKDLIINLMNFKPLIKINQNYVNQIIKTDLNGISSSSVFHKQ
ncbi:hypothetical protein E2320_020443, partial [Naja naja]